MRQVTLQTSMSLDGYVASDREHPGTAVPEDAELVQKRSEEFFKTLRPQNNLHCWYVSQISLTSLRIDRGERIERRVRDKIAIKAELFWDSDRQLDAVRLGSQPELPPT